MAILYGSDEKDEQPVEAGAEIMNTISYELLCVLTKRIPAFTCDRQRSRKRPCRIG